jgi:gingipain R
MRTSLLVLLVPLLLAALAHADSDNLSGGVLLVHAPPSLTYTSGAAWCDSVSLDSCQAQVTSLDTDSSTVAVWYILSGWMGEKNFSAVEFGLGDFEPESFSFTEHGLCLDHAFVLYYPSSEDWPGPNTGIAVATNGEPWSGRIVPIYWFAGVNYAQADTIPLTENPTTGMAGWLSQERTPYSAVCLGQLGLGVDGSSCLPEFEFRPDTSGWVSLDPLAPAFDLRLGPGNSTSTVLEMSLGGVHAKEVEINEKMYYDFSMADEPARADSCLPALPCASRALMIPNDARMAVRVLSSEYVDIPAYPVAPSKGLLPMPVDPDSVPYCFDDSVYESNDPYPTSVAELGRPYIFRDYRGISVTLNPVQALPASDSLRVYTRLTVEVYADGTDTVNIITSEPPPFIDRQFSLLYEHLFFNYEPAAALRSEEPPTRDGPMLIICADDYEANMDAFRVWKQARGIDTDLLTVSEICGSTPDPEVIADTIAARYWRDDISYVLLVGGDVDINGNPELPSLTTTDGYSDDCPSDPRYSLIDGDDSMFELFVGRFSALNSLHIDTQVRRSIDYESTLGENDLFLRHAFPLASSLVEDTPDGRTQFEWMEDRAHTLDSLGYTSHRLYGPPGGPEDVNARINPCETHPGVGLVLACAHGFWDHWDMRFPHFAVENVGVLENANRLPLIHAHSCLVGDFSHSDQDACFAEAWMWARVAGGVTDPIGAIAVYMASGYMWQRGPQYAQKGTVDLLASGEPLSVGGLLYGGAAYMMTRMPIARFQFRLWHIFGDPSLIFRSNLVPTLTVEADGSGDYETIGAAVAASVNGTNILLGDGTYTGEGNRGITSFAPKAVLLLPQSPSGDAVVIDCQTEDPFLYMANPWSQISLEHLTFTHTNGMVISGLGAVSCFNCRFADNQSESYTLYCGGDLSCDKCVFDGNQGTSGIVYCGDGEISDCAFVGNVCGSTEEGGAVVYAEDGLAMEGCTLALNDCEGGEGVGLGDECVADLEHGVIALNEGRAVGCYAALPHAGTTEIGCCDIYGNSEGDWEFAGSGIASQAGENGNLNGDPLYCDMYNQDVWRVYRGSPLLGLLPGDGPDGSGHVPMHPTACGWIGVDGVEGCIDETDVEDGTAYWAERLELRHAWLVAAQSGLTIELGWPVSLDGSKLELEIVDITGRVVRRFPAMVAGGGGMVVAWDGRDSAGWIVPAGVYFATVRADDSRRVSRMVIVH